MTDINDLAEKIFPKETGQSELHAHLLEILRGIDTATNNNGLFSALSQLSIVATPDNKYALYDNRQKTLLYSCLASPEEIGEMLTMKFQSRVYELVSDASILTSVPDGINREIFDQCIEEIRNAHGDNCDAISSLREAGIQV
jgi:hypothetical protein